MHQSPRESPKTAKEFKRYDLGGKLEIRVFAQSRKEVAEL